MNARDRALMELLIANGCADDAVSDFATAQESSSDDAATWGRAFSAASWSQRALDECAAAELDGKPEPTAEAESPRPWWRPW